MDSCGRFNHDLPSDPGYYHPGYIDVILSASSLPPQVNDSLSSTDLSANNCSPQPQPRGRRRPIFTTPSYPIELYDDERLNPVVITSNAHVPQRAQGERCMADDGESGSFSRPKSPWDAFRQYIERYRPVKIQDVALFREDGSCTTTTVAAANGSMGDNEEMSGRPVPVVVALSTDLHSLPPQILDTMITVQCAFYPSPSSPDEQQSSYPNSAQEIDMALSSACENEIVTQQQQCIVPTFMGQEDQVTTEMTLREAIESSSYASPTMAVCVAQMPIATAIEVEERSGQGGDGDPHDNDYDDNTRSVRLRLDGTIEDCTHKKCMSTSDDAPLSHLSSMLRLPSYLLLGDSKFNDHKGESSSKGGSHDRNDIVIRSINLWHAPQTCCTNVHYDDHDNLLIVTEGTKTVELCPPGCIRASGIYSEHANHPAILRNVNNRDKSEGERIQSEIEVTRNLKLNRTHIVSVSAGEALYIPQGWWHRVESTHSSSNVGCTAINVWFDYRHSSRTHNVPRHIMPFQLRYVARRYYEMNADHAANIILERKRRQAIKMRLASDDDALEKVRSISVDLLESLLREPRFLSESDMSHWCNIFSESFTLLMNNWDTLDELTTVETKNAVINRFRYQFECFLLQFNLNNAGHIQELVQLWLTFPLPTNAVQVISNTLFTKLIQELSPESCYITTQAWERHSSPAKDDDNQAEKSFKHFFQLANSSDFADKVRRHLAMGVEDFKSEIFRIVVLDRVLLGRVPKSEKKPPVPQDDEVDGDVPDDDKKLPAIPGDGSVCGDDGDVVKSDDENLGDVFFGSEEPMAVVDSFADKPKEKRKKNKSINDNYPPPPKPDITGLSEKEATEELLEWKKLRKSWSDRRRAQRLENNELLGKVITYCGDSTAIIRTMMNVEMRRLQEKDNFRCKEVVQLRIAEEANLKGITVTTLRSDNKVIVVIGHNFYVKVNNTIKRGWVVTKKVVDDGDGPIPQNEKTRKWMESHTRLLTPVKGANESKVHHEDQADEEQDEDEDNNKDGDSDPDSSTDNYDNGNGGTKSSKKKSRPPFKSEWIVPIIRPVIAMTPKAPISVLKLALAAYLKDYAMTPAVLQNARSKCFGGSIAKAEGATQGKRRKLLIEAELSMIGQEENDGGAKVGQGEDYDEAKVDGNESTL